MIARPFLIGLIATCLLALLFIPGLRPRDYLAARWRNSISTLPDTEVLPTLRKLAELGDDQIDFLVSQLGSDQERIVAPAWQVIDEQMTRWRMLKSEDSSRKVAKLASSLARHVPNFLVESKPLASDLAAKILAWPTDRKAVDMSRLIADCDLILREASRRDVVPGRKFVRRSATDRGRSNQANAGKNGIASSATTVEPPLPPLSDFMDGDRKRKAGEPRNFDPSQSKSLDSNSGGDTKAPVEDPDSVSSLANAATPEEWANRTTLEVIKLLQSKDVVEAALAAKEFRRRGFAELHHRFAEQLTSPDPQVRQKFAESLPLVGTVDVRPWLIWLSQDDDADVRLAAVSIMATRDDPEFRKRMRQLEFEESNPEVLKQIRRTQR